MGQRLGTVTLVVACLAVAARAGDQDALPEGAVARLGTMRFRHAHGVKSIAFSPDGKTLVSGTWGGKTQLWDVATGAWLHAFEGRGTMENGVAFSPTGKLVAGPEAFGSLRVWWADTGLTYFAVPSVDKPTSLAFSPDGSRLAGAVGARVLVWDVQKKGAHVVALGEEASGVGAPRVGCLRFSSDGKRLAFGREKTVRVCDGDTGQELRRFEGAAEPVALDFSADGTALVVVTSKETRELSLETGKELRALDHGGPCAAFAPDGRTLALARANQLTLVDIARDGAGTAQTWTTWHRGAIEALAFSPDGKLLASGSQDRSIRLWDVATRKEVRPFEGHGDSVQALAFSPDAKLLASGGADSTIRLWDVAARRETRPLTWKTARHLDFVSSVAFSPDGKTLVSGSWDKVVRLWDVATGNETLALRGHTQKVNTVLFLPDGKQVLSASGDATVRVWDTTTGATVRTLGAAQATTNQGAVETMALSPDGATLVTGHNDGRVVLWTLATGTEARTIKAGGWIAAVAFSPDGKRVAAATLGNPSFIRVFDVATGAEDLKLDGPKDGVESLAFSPDGERLVSGGKDSVVRFWKAGGLSLGSRERKTLKATTERPQPARDRTLEERFAEELLQGMIGGAEKANDGVHAVAFSPDGKLLASGSHEGTVILWDAAP